MPRVSISIGKNENKDRYPPQKPLKVITKYGPRGMENPPAPKVIPYYMQEGFEIISTYF